jgi:hypothetical protein
MRMVRYALVIAVVVTAHAFLSGSPVLAQVTRNPKVQMPHYDEPGDLAGLPILGRWKINVDKSTQNGSRANSNTFTWIFRIEGDRIRHDIYDVYPSDRPSRSYAVKLNGSESSDPHEPGIGETISWWPINRSMFYREVKQNGKVTQHTIYSVSPDGKVFTSQSWSPTNPNPRGMSNLMYFERQDGAAGSK